MLFKLLLLFVIVPLVELVLLLMFAGTTGHWIFSVLLVLVTGLLGAYLARGQGTAALHRLRSSMSNSQVPTTELLDAALIFFAGALLLTPGILTDIAGISMMIPKCRSWYRQRLITWFKNKFRIQITSPFGDPNVVDSYVVDPDVPSDSDDQEQPQSSPPQHSGLVEHRDDQ